MANSQRLWVAVALAAAVTGVVSAQAQVSAPSPFQAGPPGNGFVAGQVVDADTGRGVPGAAVALLGVRVNGPGAGQTVGRPLGVVADSQGRFFFAGLGPGTGAMQAQLADYMPVGTTQRVEIAADTRITDIRLMLRRLGSVAGRVTDDTGAPAVGLDVVLFRRIASQGRPATLVSAARTRSDDKGEYRFAGVAADEYLIAVAPRDPIPFDPHLLTTLAARPMDLLGAAGRAAAAGSGAVALDPALRTLPLTFYPGTTSASQAQRVRVEPGRDVSGAHIAVTAAPAFRVSGRIIGAPSAVLASHLRLRVYGDLPEAAAVTQIVPMLVQPDGRFDFANVPPGQYVLDVNFRPGARGGGPSGAALAFIGARGQLMQAPAGAPPVTDAAPPNAPPPLWAQQPITISNSDVTDLVIGLNPSLTMTGRVVFDGTAPAPAGQALSRLTVQLISLEMGPQIRSFIGRLQPDLSFTITGIVPGRYVLGIPPAAAYTFTRSITARGDDLTERLIEISTDLTDVVVTVVDTAPASITTRIAPAPQEGELVYARVFPADRKYWVTPFAAPLRFRSSHVEPNGETTVQGLPPGEYFVALAAEGGSEWMDPETLERLSRAAERVRVGEGEEAAVEVRR